MKRQGLLALGGFCAISLAGCQDYLFEQKCPAAITQAQKTVAEIAPVPADILFVVDNSCSMADEQDKLAQNFDAFINEIAGAANLDYRIAVVTTDLSLNDFENQGRVEYSYDTNSQWRVLTGSDRSMCSQTSIAHGCFRSGGSQSFIDSKALQPQEQISAFQQNVRVGSCGAGREEGLEGMLKALELMQGNGCNSSFLRPEANLIVILVSDEEDNSPPSGSGRDQRSIPQIVDALSRFKPINQVRVATVVGSVDGEPARCRTGGDGKAEAQCGSICAGPMPPQGSGTRCSNQAPCTTGEVCNGGRCENSAYYYWSNCNSCTFFSVEDCCAADPGRRYIDFARAVEAQVAAMDDKIDTYGCRAPENTRAACLVDSICQADFSKTLSRVARELVIESTYRLDPPASYPEGVTLRISGGRYAQAKDAVYGTDFTISNNGASLEITNGEFIPQGGDEKLDIFFTVEKELQAPLEGACATPEATN